MKSKRDKQLESLLFEAYEKGVNNEDCDLTTYIEKVKKALTIDNIVGQSEPLPFDFVKWYSGMEEQKILNAYKRWQKEKG